MASWGNEIYVIEAWKFEDGKRDAVYETRPDLENARACANSLFKKLGDQGYKTTILHAFRMNWDKETKGLVDPPELYDVALSAGS